MKTERSILHSFVTTALFVLAVGGQIIVSDAAQARPARHVAIESAYGTFQGFDADRRGTDRGPRDFRHDDEPTLSERLGTN